MRFILLLLPLFILTHRAWADETKVGIDEPASESPRCFNPKTDPTIAKHLKAGTFKSKSGKNFTDTADSIEQIHDLIWAHRHEIDPRLVYYRILGETTFQDPLITGMNSAYGIFQFQNKGDKAKVKRLIANNPHKSARLIEVDYYMNTYLKNFINMSNHLWYSKGSKCKNYGKFSQMSNIVKLSYLGLGSCTSGKKGAITREQNRCQSPKGENHVNYEKNGSCALLNSINKLPLCDSI